MTTSPISETPVFDAVQADLEIDPVALASRPKWSFAEAMERLDKASRPRRTRKPRVA